VEAIGALVLIILVIIAIGLALGVLWCGAVGAMHQFAWASEMGFVGVVIFFAAWIFMFPIMAIWAVIWGFTVIKN
jgi:hypothetical protein